MIEVWILSATLFVNGVPTQMGTDSKPYLAESDCQIVGYLAAAFYTWADEQYQVQVNCDKTTIHVDQYHPFGIQELPE